jgi:Flp pilus assembly protein TadG
MRILSEERGNILILTALCMTMLLSFMAMAIDVGNLYYTKCQLQTLADAAAMAGALEVDICISAGTLNCGAMQTAANQALVENGIAASGSGVLLTINNGPSALGSSDPNAGSKYYVEAVVAKPVSTYFAKIFGKDTVTVSARAEAGKAKPSGPCIITNKLTLNSSASITSTKDSTCGIYDNGDLAEGDPSTVNVNGSFIVNGNKTGGGGSYTPAPTSGQMVPDPIKAEIDAGTLTVPTMTTGMTTYNQSSNTTLSAGYYPSGFNFSSGVTYTLGAGVYYMGANVILNSGAVLNGTGVTIYLASGAGINSNGNGSTINLTAPTSGPTAGVLIWGNTSTVNLNTLSGSSFGGTIYLPSGQLTLNSAAGATSYGLIVADSVMTDEKSTIILNGSGGGGNHNGSLTIALAE